MQDDLTESGKKQYRWRKEGLEREGGQVQGVVEDLGGEKEVLEGVGGAVRGRSLQGLLGGLGDQGGGASSLDTSSRCQGEEQVGTRRGRSDGVPRWAVPALCAAGPQCVA